MGLFGKKKPEVVVAGLGGDGTYPYEDVVGESFHRDSLLGLIRKAPRDQQERGEVTGLGLVIADPNNSHDPNAVAVFVDGSQVGHIARDSTDLIHEVLAMLGERGYSSDGFHCPAVIAWSGDPAAVPIGVRLDLVIEQDGE